MVIDGATTGANNSVCLWGPNAAEKSTVNSSQSESVCLKVASKVISLARAMQLFLNASLPDFQPSKDACFYNLQF